MLRKIRIILAGISFILCTLLFLDFSGLLTSWFGWVAKIQFLPAALALNLAVVAVLLILTLLMGRVYCSVICPMGIFQDIVAWTHKGRRKKTRKWYSWSPEKKILRYGFFIIFIVALIAGANAIVALLAPYSSYGRIAQNLFQPICIWGNNLFAFIAEKFDSYAFAHKEVWLRSLPTFIIASATFVTVMILAWRNGRTYCNTICPVGTFLSFFSRFSIFRPVIDTSKCKTCHLCERNCKAACIDLKNHKVDYSRCVDCFDCIDTCKFGAMQYKPFWQAKAGEDSTAGKNASSAGENASNGKNTYVENTGSHNPSDNTVNGNSAQNNSDNGRRAFIGASVLALGSLTVKAQEKKVDGGLAAVIGKKKPERTVPLVPFGAEGIDSFYSHCTACQLCVSQCPNNILRPSTSLEHLMQPEMSYEKGWCRVECTKCSEVCPAGAILPITKEEKTAIHIGTATVDRELCVVNRDGVACGNCARHCPAGAIMLVKKDPSDKDSLRIPAVNEDKCIGCGACEYVCPSRPYSAIKVNGLTIHRKG